MATGVGEEVAEVASDGRGEARVMLWRIWKWGEDKVDAVRSFQGNEETEENSASLAQLQPGASMGTVGTVRCRNGTEVPVEVSAKRLIDGRLQALVRDISDRKRSEAAQQRYTETLEALSGASLQLASFESATDVLDSILHYAVDLLGFARGGIYA